MHLIESDKVVAKDIFQMNSPYALLNLCFLTNMLQLKRYNKGDIKQGLNNKPILYLIKLHMF